MTTNHEFLALIELLIEADDLYYNSGNTYMTDAEYDRLKKKAFSIDPSHDYFAKVGSDVRGGKIKLPYTMGSLDQVHENEFLPWCQKYNLMGKSVIITEKLDGISCMLVYRNGELEIAYSRGNGVEGADITRHVRKLKNLPFVLKGEDYMTIRGELIMKNDTFNDNGWDTEYKNPRAAVAGTMNRSDSNNDILGDIDFVSYEIVATNGTMNNTKLEHLNKLEKLGFDTVARFEVKAVDSTVNDEFLTEMLSVFREQGGYELDGIVITANNIEQAQGKRNAISLNPEHSCKYKIEETGATTLVEALLWEISKNGLFKPRLMVEPVELNGTTVTYITGNNAKFIYDNEIGLGAEIYVIKAGTVIPQCKAVIKPASFSSMSYHDYFNSMIDGVLGVGNWSWNETGVDIIVNDHHDHGTVKFKQVLDFVETLNVDLLKEGSLQKMFDTFGWWDCTFDQIILEMVDLKEKEWNSAVGANGSKSYLSLHRRLQNLELSTLIGASKHMGAGFGVRKAKSLIAGSNKVVWDLDVLDVVMMEGFEEKTARQAVEGLKELKPLYDALMDSGYINLVTISKTNELEGMQVVMTGFRDAELSAEIEKRGGKIGSGVSKKTTYLLTYDASSNSGKAQKARELGVTVMTPDDFKDLFNL